jgi:hypothetical protein
MKRNIITAAIATAAVLIATGAGAANLVTNRDFDNIGGVWSDNTGLGSNDLRAPEASPFRGGAMSAGSPTNSGSKLLTAIAALQPVRETAASISST